MYKTLVSILYSFLKLEIVFENNYDSFISQTYNIAYVVVTLVLIQIKDQNTDIDYWK